MILDLHDRLAASLREVARRTLGAEPASVAFTYPPRPELGDLASTAPFDLAKQLRRKPREIAEALAAELGTVPGVLRAEAAGGGYVNLFLDRGAFARALEAHLAAPVAPAGGQRVIVEHTSINPNKAAHIGHVRNATLGDTFVRALRRRGRSVGIQNYIDDTGVQVADVVVGFQHIEGKTLADVAALGGKFDYYCWDLYARVGDFYAADPARKKLQAETLHAIEAGGNDTALLAEHVAARIVDCHLATMERLGIRYELLAHESDILRLHFWDRAFELLKQAGAIRLEAEGKNAGCWVLSMEEGRRTGRCTPRRTICPAVSNAICKWRPGHHRPQVQHVHQPFLDCKTTRRAYPAPRRCRGSTGTVPCRRDRPRGPSPPRPRSASCAGKVGHHHVSRPASASVHRPT